MVGKLPFDGKNPAQVLRRVLEGAFTPSERARPTVGAGLGAIVDRALAKEPRDRYASCSDVAEALRSELRSLGFEDPLAEIAAYLHDPKTYRVDFEERVVEALVARGRKAREDRDVPLATTSFNRALAFRPDDTDLISEVSSLARTERFRHALMQGVVILTGSLIIAAALGGVFKIVAKLRGTDHKKPVAAASARNLNGAALVPAAGRPDGSAEPATPTKKKRSRASRVVEPPKEITEAPASVTVLVNGPANATVLVDGQPLDNWFGAAHDLPAGEHRFEFRPPNTECCEGPTFKTVSLPPGEPFTVKGAIQWKPATLDFRGSPLSTASCGEVASFSEPGTRLIPMQSAGKKARCTVIPAPQSGEAPITFDLDLSPGRTSSFPRP
jgi:serine/threonine-protein kinase